MKSQLQDQLHLRGMDPLQGRKLFVRKRDARIEEFNEARICLAIESAFKAVEGVGRDANLTEALQAAVKKSADAVVERVLGRAVRGEQLEVERIQDAVEDQLMLDGHLAVARCYILYREKRRLARAEREGRSPISAVAAPAQSRDIPSTPTFPKKPRDGALETLYRNDFSAYINEGEYLNLLAPELLDFDLEMLAGALRLERDELFSAPGLQALYDDFLLHDNGRRFEAPQYFWMRLAMGLAFNEGEGRNRRAVEFYEVLSTFRFVPSETVLCHAGTPEPRLMACFAATGWGDLEHVKAQMGSRMAERHKKGLTCSWLEPWHIGIWDFLQRPPPGGPAWEQDLNKALWLPDLFIKRVRQTGPWTLFDPAQVPDLHQLFGPHFDERYLEYEEKAKRAEMPGCRQINAIDLWQEILASLAQTGQPWIGFKDAANLRSPQDHTGIVHAGSLCTAILSNTAPGEAFACSLGSINLAAHLAEEPGLLEVPLLRTTIGAAMRMIDNAIDISSYPNDAVRATSREHRPAGLGILGFQDALDRLKMDYASAAAADFADRSMEIISHCAIMASSSLARERGAYPSYAGSKWSHGILPIDTVSALDVDTDLCTTEDWKAVREIIRRDGARHCTITAISSTEAGSRITGASPSIEPALAVKPEWLIECAARRQKWLDMSQTLTLYATEDRLAALGEIYALAWKKGLKTIRQLQPAARSTAEAESRGEEFKPQTETEPVASR
jgi:ribonucleoside-diphosphate reductase alpha chain